jgi:hypothetical protein
VVQNALKYSHAGGKVQVRGNLGAVYFIIPRKTFQSRRGQTGAVEEPADNLGSGSGQGLLYA